MESCSQKLGWSGTLRLQWIRAPRHQLPPWLFREICSIRFLFTAVSLLSIFLAGEEQWLPGTPALYVGSQVQLPRLSGLQPTLVTPPTWSPTYSWSLAFTPTPRFLPCFISEDTFPPFLSPALWWGLLYLIPPLENVSWGDPCSQEGWRLCVWGDPWAAGRGQCRSTEQNPEANQEW